MKEPRAFKLLYIEDDNIDIMAFKRHFIEDNNSYDCDIANTVDKAFELLNSDISYDVIISDYQLPDGLALDILNGVNDIPVIIVTGAGDEKLAVTALKKGAYDYITKDSSSGYLTMLPHTIEKALAHKQDRLRLKASELRYQKLIESANDVIYEADEKGVFLYVNGLSEKITGYTPIELVGTSFKRLILSNDEDNVASFYISQHHEKLPSTYLEFEILRKDGSKLWVGQNVTTLFDENRNTIIGYLGVVRDISLKKEYELKLESVNEELEQKVVQRTKKLSTIATNLTKEIERRQEVEQELRISRQNYIELFNNVNEAIIVIDPRQEIIVEANNKSFELYGYSREELIGISLVKISTELEKEKKYIDDVFYKGKLYTCETIHLDKLNNQIYVEINATKIKYDGKEMVLCVDRDITKNKLIEKQLEIERKKRVSSLIDGQEIERKRLSRDLHDGLGQLLFAIKLHVRKLMGSKHLGDSDKVLVDDITEILEMTIVETRQIYQNLLPSSLSDFGLEVALKQITKVVNENFDNTLIYEFHGTPRRLNSDLEIGIYRIAQEAINNSTKHSKAEKIWVVLEMEDQRVQLQIKDNGIGISTNTVQNSIGSRLSHGMNNMKQRAEILGINFQIMSKENEGTSITLTANINDEKREH